MNKQNQKAPSFLHVDSLGYRVDGQSILTDINFEIAKGERVAIFGPSGAGKSTLIRLLNRLDEPTTGTVYIGGQDYKKIPPRVLRQRLGLVMQTSFLFPGTVAENIRFGPASHGEALGDDQVRALLAGVDMAGFAERDVSKLSGGEAQRVNLARTLANNPEVLLLDEPTSSLDQASRHEVEGTIRSVIQSTTVTCILVTHDEKQVKRMCDRVLMIEAGQLMADGPVKEILNAQSVD